MDGSYTSMDHISILRDFNVDRASGEKLKRIAKEENINLIMKGVTQSSLLQGS